MKRKIKFNTLLISSFVSIFALILMFIFLNTFIHTKVVAVNLNGNKDNANISNQQIRIDFNRPIKKETIENNINIEPTIKFRSLWSGNTLVIIPDSSLDSQTKYTITVNKNIVDIYGDTLTEDFNYEFTTEIPKFAVIEKIPASNLDTIAIYNADQTGRQQLLQRENIVFYGINSNYLVLVTEDKYKNNIEILNRNTGEVKDFNLPNIRINSFSFSPSKYKNEFAYIKQEIEVYPTYYLPRSDAKVYVYNIDTQEEKEFNPQDTAKDVAFIEYSRDGSSLLYKTGDSFFNLAETDQQEEYVGIGRFLSNGNFNYDNTLLALINFDPLNTYTTAQFITVFDSNRNTKQITNGDTPALDPQFKNRTNEILYAEFWKELPTTKGIYKIVQTDLEGNKIDIIKSENFSLELPTISADDRYIAMEQYTEINLKDYSKIRNYGFQNKPYSGSIIIFDTTTNKVYDNKLIGINVKWLN